MRLVTSSTTFSTRNRRPSASWSCTNSRLQRWMGSAIPLDMNAGDFDFVKDPDGKAFQIFERVHSELVCADLTSDYLSFTGNYSTHFHLGAPPRVREAPAYFVRAGHRYLLTSGTTGYHPNPSKAASAASMHGPWTDLGDLHPTDSSRTSFNSQISSVFKHPDKKDLYITLQIAGYMTSRSGRARLSRVDKHHQRSKTCLRMFLRGLPQLPTHWL